MSSLKGLQYIACSRKPPLLKVGFGWNHGFCTIMYTTTGFWITIYTTSCVRKRINKSISCYVSTYIGKENNQGCIEVTSVVFTSWIDRCLFGWYGVSMVGDSQLWTPRSHWLPSSWQIILVTLAHSRWVIHQVGLSLLWIEAPWANFFFFPYWFVSSFTGRVQQESQQSWPSHLVSWCLFGFKNFLSLHGD